MQAELIALARFERSAQALGNAFPGVVIAHHHAQIGASVVGFPGHFEEGKSDIVVRLYIGGRLGGKAAILPPAWGLTLSGYVFERGIDQENGVVLTEGKGYGQCGYQNG